MLDLLRNRIIEVFIRYLGNGLEVSFFVASYGEEEMENAAHPKLAASQSVCTSCLYTHMEDSKNAPRNFSVLGYTNPLARI